VHYEGPKTAAATTINSNNINNNNNNNKNGNNLHCYFTRFVLISAS